MSKRSHPDAHREDSGSPSPKRKRYAYNANQHQQQQQKSSSSTTKRLPRTTTSSDEETLSENELIKQSSNSSHNNNNNGVLLPLTTKKIADNIASASLMKDGNVSWDAAHWFFTRIQGDNAAHEFIKELPMEETKGVAKDVLAYHGSFVTYHENLITILKKMQKIKKAIEINNNNKHRDHGNHYSKSRKPSRKQKRKFVTTMDAYFNKFPLDSFDNKPNIDKMKSYMKKFNKENDEYDKYEEDCRNLWGSSVNNTPCSTPPGNINDITNNNNSANTASNTNNSSSQYKDISDFDSDDTDTDHESDDDFSPNDDGDVNDLYDQRKKRKKNKGKKNNKRKKKKKKKAKREKREREEREREAAKQQELEAKQALGDQYIPEGKNPQQAKLDPDKFWNRFLPMVEPYECDTNPKAQNMVHELLEKTHPDSFPINIPQLPTKPQLTHNSDDYHQNGNNNNESYETTNNDDKKDGPYFAEMPKEYEHFGGEKCYIEEQRNLENASNSLKQDAIFQQFPSIGLFGHSFAQRTLQGLVHACPGMYDIEATHGDISENYWNQIGKTSKPINDIRATEAERKKKNFNKIVLERYNVNDMIEPEIKYKVFDPDKEKSMKSISFHSALEQEINRTLFKQKFKNNVKEIKKMKWSERTDDEVCATIKSLQNAMENDVYQNCPLEIEQHIATARELRDIITTNHGQNNNPFRNYQTAKEYIEDIENLHRESLGDPTNPPFTIDHRTMSEPRYTEWFIKSQNCVTEASYQGLRPSKKISQ